MEKITKYWTLIISYLIITVGFNQYIYWLFIGFDPKSIFSLQQYLLHAIRPVTPCLIGGLAGWWILIQREKKEQYKIEKLNGEISMVRPLRKIFKLQRNRPLRKNLSKVELVFSWLIGIAILLFAPFELLIAAVFVIFITIVIGVIYLLNTTYQHRVELYRVLAPMLLIIYSGFTGYMEADSINNNRKYSFMELRIENSTQKFKILAIGTDYAVLSSMDNNTKFFTKINEGEVWAIHRYDSPIVIDESNTIFSELVRPLFN